ncbi:MAG: hypothetical protein ACUVXI_09455 [bacterium]
MKRFRSFVLFSSILFSLASIALPILGAKVSLRYLMWDPGIQELEEKLIQTYQKDHPNVSIAIESAPFAQF